MEKWNCKSLGEVTSLMTKGIAPSYTESKGEHTIFVLNQKCNRNFTISYSDARLNDIVKKKVPEDRILQPGDVLINSTGTGTAGRVAQIWTIPYKTTIDGHMILLRPTDELDVLFYGYALKMHQAQIEALAEGSTGQTEINRTRLCNEVLISYPESKDTQKRVANLLACLDNHIEVNSMINDNLAA